MKISGIYSIKNKRDNKIYIGCSINIHLRIRKHKEALARNNHPNIHLQNAVNKYGIENFEFEILEEYPEEYINSMELYWINLLNSTDDKYGYNLRCGHPIHLGKISESSRKCMINSRQKVEVVVLDKDGKYVTEFSRTRDLVVFLNSSLPSIYNCLNKKKNIILCKGYMLIYKKDYQQQKDYSYISQLKKKRQVEKYNLNGDILESFTSPGEAAANIGKASSANIIRSCRSGGSAYGYRWRYKPENEN